MSAPVGAPSARLRLIALGLGAACGIGLAAWDLLAPEAAGGADLPAEVVATVDGAPITQEELERALEAVRADRRGERLAEGDRERVLERLIDEQLLVARALELGLPARDGRLRAELAGAMRDLLVARAEEEEAPSEEELLAFHREHRALFSSPPRYRLEHAFFLVEAEAEAEAALRQEGGDAPLAGGAPPPLPLPAGRVSFAALRQRLGPTIARSVSGLEVGAIGGPYRAQGGYHLLRLLEREGGAPLPFEEVREAVRAEVERRARERRLTDFYREARRSAVIRRAGSR